MNYRFEHLDRGGWLTMRVVDAEHDDEALDLFDEWSAERKPPAGSYRIVIVTDEIETSPQREAPPTAGYRSEAKAP